MLLETNYILYIFFNCSDNLLIYQLIYVSILH